MMQYLLSKGETKNILQDTVRRKKAGGRRRGKMPSKSGQVFLLPCHRKHPKTQVGTPEIVRDNPRLLDNEGKLYFFHSKG